MSAWSGFTEEELNKLRQQDKAIDEDNARPKERLKKSMIDGNRAKRNRPREKIPSRSTNTPQQEQQQPPRTQTSKDCEKPSTTEDRGVVEQAKERSESASSVKKDEEESKEQQVSSTSNAVKDSPEVKEVDIKIISAEELASLEMTAIEKMQKRQKEMEELNKKKKLLLQETIKQRYRKTQVEAATLNMVQKELAHLDSLLTVDVTILREKIDEASRCYYYAQKRYEKAEAEFVAAKLELHKQEERKEELTEHLCALIQENEKRKAAKLEELMARLDLANNMAESVVLCETEGVQTDPDLEGPHQASQARTEYVTSVGVMDTTLTSSTDVHSNGISSQTNEPSTKQKPEDKKMTTEKSSCHSAGTKTEKLDNDETNSPSAPPLNTEAGQIHEPLRDGSGVQC